MNNHLADLSTQLLELGVGSKSGPSLAKSILSAQHDIEALLKEVEVLEEKVKFLNIDLGEEQEHRDAAQKAISRLQSILRNVKQSIETARKNSTTKEDLINLLLKELNSF